MSQGGRGKKERKSQAGSVLTVNPPVGLDVTNLRSGPELKARVGHVTDGATRRLYLGRV